MTGFFMENTGGNLTFLWKPMENSEKPYKAHYDRPPYLFPYKTVNSGGGRSKSLHND